MGASAVHPRCLWYLAPLRTGSAGFVLCWGRGVWDLRDVSQMRFHVIQVQTFRQIAVALIADGQGQVAIAVIVSWLCIVQDADDRFLIAVLRADTDHAISVFCWSSVCVVHGVLLVRHCT